MAPRFAQVPLAPWAAASRLRRGNSLIVQRLTARPEPGTRSHNMPFALLLVALSSAVRLRRAACAVGRGAHASSSSEEVIMRIPVRPRSVAAVSNGTNSKGPKCIDAANIRGRCPVRPVQRSTSCCSTGTRLRAQLDEDCPALDFYNGFYLTARRREDLRQARRHPLADRAAAADRALPPPRPARHRANSLTSLKSAP